MSRYWLDLTDTELVNLIILSLLVHYPHIYFFLSGVVTFHSTSSFIEYFLQRLRTLGATYTDVTVVYPSAQCLPALGGTGLYTVWLVSYSSRFGMCDCVAFVGGVFYGKGHFGIYPFYIFEQGFDLYHSCSQLSTHHNVPSMIVR